MGLILRSSSLANSGDSVTVKGSTLDWVEGDGNFVYLLNKINSGSGVPGGLDTQIQFNSGSTFAGDSTFTFNYTNQSLQQGDNTTANGYASHTEGYKTSTVLEYSHAEGDSTVAAGYGAHSEGTYTSASGNYSHTEGYGAIASGEASHAEGFGIADGQGSHAEGINTRAIGIASHAGGYGTVASGSYQTAIGRHNTENNTDSLFVIGGGISGSRKDIFDARVDASGSGSVMIPVNPSDPTNPTTGSMYFNPSTNLLYIYNGTAWKSASLA